MRLTKTSIARYLLICNLQEKSSRKETQKYMLVDVANEETAVISPQPRFLLDTEMGGLRLCSQLLYACHVSRQSAYLLIAVRPDPAPHMVDKNSTQKSSVANDSSTP